MSIVEQMVEQGYTSDSERDRAILLLAKLEDMAEAGTLAEDPDELAAARHLLMELP